MVDFWDFLATGYAYTSLGGEKLDFPGAIDLPQVRGRADACRVFSYKVRGPSREGHKLGFLIPSRKNLRLILLHKPVFLSVLKLIFFTGASQCKHFDNLQG